jgi:hypothetical protein
MSRTNLGNLVANGYPFNLINPPPGLPEHQQLLAWAGINGHTLAWRDERRLVDGYLDWHSYPISK